jgi:hypothetical protein
MVPYLGHNSHYPRSAVSFCAWKDTMAEEKDQVFNELRERLGKSGEWDKWVISIDQSLHSTSVYQNHALSLAKTR